MIDNHGYNKSNENYQYGIDMTPKPVHTSKFRCLSGHKVYEISLNLRHRIWGTYDVMMKLSIPHVLPSVRDRARDLRHLYNKHLHDKIFYGKYYAL